MSATRAAELFLLSYVCTRTTPTRAGAGEQAAPPPSATGVVVSASRTSSQLAALPDTSRCASELDELTGSSVDLIGRRIDCGEIRDFLKQGVFFGSRINCQTVKHCRYVLV